MRISAKFEAIKMPTDANGSFHSYKILIIRDYSLNLPFESLTEQAT